MKTSAFITGKYIALQQDLLYRIQKDIREVQKRKPTSTLFIECRYDGVLSCLAEKHENCQKLILES